MIAYIDGKCKACGKRIHNIKFDLYDPFAKRRTKIPLCDLCVESGVMDLVNDLFTRFDKGEIKVGFFGWYKYRPIVTASYRVWKAEKTNEPRSAIESKSIFEDIKHYLGSLS